MGDSDPVASLSSIRECLSESDIADAPNRLKQEESEVDVDSSLQEVDFSSDFTEGPGQNEIIKAIATRWTATRNIVKKAGLKIGVPKVQDRLQDIKKRMKGEPFLRAKDKFSFLLGVMLMLFTEYIVISWPQYLYIVYTVIFIPLIGWRFFSYHSHKHHYFMLDFCYFDNLLLMVWIYVFPQNLKLFKLVFALSVGPLLMAVIAWSNSLVFHDLDRVTSLFIHVYPPLVLYCERWKNPANFVGYPAEQVDWATLPELVWVPLLFYTAWQVAYLLKTEVMDRKKFVADEEMVTSARWLTRIKPHFVYQWLRKRGVNLHPNIILCTFQLCYTLLMLLPTLALYHFQLVNIAVLIGVIAFATWNGANYYFEIFSERYRNRLINKSKHEQDESPKFGFLPSSSRSVFKFAIWLGGFMSVVTAMIHYFC